MDSYEIEQDIVARIDEANANAEDAREIELTAGEVSTSDLDNVTPARVPQVIQRLTELTIASQSCHFRSCGPQKRSRRAFDAIRMGIV